MNDESPRDENEQAVQWSADERARNAAWMREHCPDLFEEVTV